MRLFKQNSAFLLAAAPLVIGGQAVMEGVLMKSKHYLATAVRKPDTTIIVRSRREESFLERHRLTKIPLLRGIVILFETMILGMKELAWSANQALDEEGEELTTAEILFTLAFSVILVLLFFKLLPLFLATFITKNAAGGNWMLNLLDGTIKLSLFIAYLLLIGTMKDVKRLFQYHGAEHKSVNCYEAGKRLTPRNARSFTKKQPRCGTTFILYVFVLSIIFYLFIPFGSGFWMKYLLRILLLPIIAGVVYEWVRIAGRYYHKSRLVRVISAPAMAVQALTTREPDLKQLAVAITALQRVIRLEKNAEKE